MDFGMLTKTMLGIMKMRIRYIQETKNLAKVTIDFKEMR